jgi:beta-lactamase regulating signal transducer with metallopeptidase domain
VDFLFELAWKNIAVAGILALAATVAGRFLRRPAVAHGLWLLVLLKLVTPPLWQVPVPWLASKEAASNAEIDNHADNLEQDYAAAMAAAAMLVPGDANRADTRPDPRPGKSVPGMETLLPADAQLVSSPSTSIPTAISAPLPTFRMNWQQAILGAWAVGSAAWLGLLLVRLRRFRRLAALATPAGEVECRRVAELADSIGLKRAPALRLLNACVPPMTWGFGGRHELIVPAELWNSLSSGQRDVLVLHELAHLRRGDHWIRGFELLVFVLHWWHPLSWWARHELQEAEEECCDAWVVRALPNRAGDYADLIVETVAYLNRLPSPALPPLASGLGQIQHVRKRLAAILHGPGSPRLSRMSWLGLAVLGCGLLPMLPTLAKEPGGILINLVDSLGRRDQKGSREPGSSSSSEIGAGNLALPLDNAAEPTEINLMILRLQLVQREADVVEERLLLNQAAKRAQREKALIATGAASGEALQPYLGDQQTHEARLRSREASVQELVLRIRQEELRVESNARRIALLASGAIAKVGQIVISGNDTTPDDLILRQAGFYPGQAVSEADLQIAESHLLKLNRFEVDPANGIRPTVTILHPESDEEFKDILISVKESSAANRADRVKKAQSSQAPAIQQRLDKMEKRLDDLFTEAKALQAELESERTRQK